MNRNDNITNAIKDLSTEKILLNLNNEMSEEDKPYLDQYEFIARHFKKFGDKPTYDDYVIGSHIVYAWMPRVLRFKVHSENEQERVMQVLAKANKEDYKNKEKLTPEELSLIASPLSGSLVAPSKFLHFLNPKAWPIWDSRVYRGIMELNGNKASAYHYEMQDIDTYITYVNMLRSLASQNRHFGEEARKPYLKTATNIRCLELGLFLAGKMAL